MKTMWAVTSGSYSDYHVLCVCDSEARAKRIAATPTGGYPSYDVQTIPYRDDDPQQIVIHGLECEVWDDGTATEQRTSIEVEWDFDMLWPERNVRSISRWVRAPVHKNHGGRLEVHGNDLEAVRHSFSDLRAQLMTTSGMRGKREFTQRSRA